MKEIIKKILDCKLLITIIMSSLTYIVFFVNNSLLAYDITSWIIYFVLIMLFHKTNIYNKKYKSDIIILSILFAFLTVFGKIINSNKELYYINSIMELIQPKSIFSIIGYFNSFFIILTNIFPKLCEIKFKKNKNIISKKYIIFLISFILILLGWLPYFLNFYPGLLSYDSFSELSIIINNFSSVSDHHPVLHTLFISLPYNIGMSIFNNMNSAIALVTITQMIIMSSIFSYFITFLHSHKVNNFILLLIMMFYAFVPMHGYYSVTMWKDIIFAGLVLLLTIETFKIVENIDKLAFKKLIPFIIISIFCVFFRNNAIYMYMILFIVSILLFKQHFKKFFISFFIVFFVFFFVKGPVFNWLNIKKSSSAEYIGIPLQQVGRMAFKNVGFSNEEFELLNKLMPVDEIANNYNPVSSDSIKFNKNYNAKQFDDNKLKYFELYLKLILKHPDVAIEAYSTSTLGYWYPGLSYWSVLKNTSGNDYSLKNESKVSNNLSNYINTIDSRNNPIINMEWSIGLCFWILLIFFIVTLRKNGINSIYPFIPVFGIWVTMMLASPVIGEFRYVYGAYTCLPLLLLVPYINKTK